MQKLKPALVLKSYIVTPLEVHCTLLEKISQGSSQTVRLKFLTNFL
jgi:hypothetical protein